MFNSTRYSYLILRLGLAAVFLWLGIDKIIHPNYWLTAWAGRWTISVLSRVGLNSLQFVYLSAIFELLIGISMLSGLFVKFFSLLAIIFLISVFFSVGFGETAVRDIGLIGGFLAIFFWPKTISRF